MVLFLFAESSCSDRRHGCRISSFDLTRNWFRVWNHFFFFDTHFIAWLIYASLLLPVAGHRTSASLRCLLWLFVVPPGVDMLVMTRMAFADMRI